MKNRTSLWIIVFAIVILFIFSSYLTQQSVGFFKELIGDGAKGMMLYVLFVILEVVVAPVSVVPLIPVATAIWGWLVSALLFLIGWTLGSLIAFQIARRHGVPLLKREDTFKKIRKIENIIPERNIFWGIVLLRFTIPLDLLSYAIGIFSGVNWKVYTLATLVGFAPLTFALAYLGTFSTMYQIILFVFGLIISSFFFSYYKKHDKIKEKIKKKWNKRFR